MTSVHDRIAIHHPKAIGVSPQDRMVRVEIPINGRPMLINMSPDMAKRVAQRMSDAAMAITDPLAIPSFLRSFVPSFLRAGTPENQFLRELDALKEERSL